MESKSEWRCRAYLAGEEGEGALAWLEERDDPSNELVIRLLFQVGLKTDVGALHLRRHMHREICVALWIEHVCEGVMERVCGREGVEGVMECVCMQEGRSDGVYEGGGDGECVCA